MYPLFFIRYQKIINNLKWIGVSPIDTDVKRTYRPSVKYLSHVKNFEHVVCKFISITAMQF